MADTGPGPWTKVGDSAADLVRALTDLYWEALEPEIANAVLSLNNVLRLRKEQPDAGIGPQSIEQRMSARLEEPVYTWDPLGLSWEDRAGCHEVAQDLLLGKQTVEDDYLLSRMFLGGVGMLDIDEVIVYREPTLPSEEGPPEFEAVMDDDGMVSLFSITCDVCDNPVRGMSWTCRLGCRPVGQDSEAPADPMRICMSCYSADRHTKAHLLPVPHRYALSDIAAHVTTEQFWQLRKELQQRQDEVDFEQDRRTVGVIWNAVARTLSSWSRKDEGFPLGNIHAAVTFGPLVFETGVEGSKGGVRISPRQTLDLGRRWPNLSPVTILALDRKRQLYKSTRRLEHPPIQAAIKQVVGGAFAGYHAHLKPVEDRAILMLFDAASTWSEQPLKPRKANGQRLHLHAKNIINIMKPQLDVEIQSYIRTLAATMMGPGMNLGWNKYTNNCQNFCDSLLQGEVFAHVFPGRESLRGLPTQAANQDAVNYVISFRTAPELGKVVESTKLSIGPMTAFLKQVHRPTNVLQYQESQGRRTLNETQLCAQIFAWPCQSEECDLADHPWTNPAELVSMLQFHLLSDRGQYSYVADGEGPHGSLCPLSEVKWVRQRLAVLQALDSFVAAAAAINQAFQEKLASEPTRGWNPPTAPSIPQSIPFQCADDAVHYQQEDLGSKRTRKSLFGSGPAMYETGPQIELPAEYTLLGERPVVFMPTVGAALAPMRDGEEADILTDRESRGS
ncbi:hypothetical protein PV04_02662 [Phialophora macrospora]|uniref:ZZ-type domain-containing protein n=1 Tax=Phialophora macrospora TaxID=1851006 RepID=A0A0D2GE17_9EURO|nr:hypothetical protein PV04_02662 [Phialophora macrospora]